jgi:glycosyltransferase involved in cell wall biosynthesis
MDKDVSPLVTVLMPVFNGQSFLKEAIQSILDQSYSHFELLIYNDGSTDQTQEIINSFEDKRIVRYNDRENSGYVCRLNHGFSVAKGKYIARMDADDVSFTHRLKMQVEFMEHFSEIGICGSHVEIIDLRGKSLGKSQHYTNDELLRIKLLADSCFAHPSVMIRKSVVDANNLRYDENFTPAEDYQLWYTLSLITKLANLPDILLKYRVHDTQITQRKKEIQKTAADAIRKKTIQDFLGCPVTEKNFDLHNTLFSNNFTPSISYVQDARNWLTFLISHNRVEKRFSEELFEKFVSEIWFSLCTHSYKLGAWIVFFYFNSGFQFSSISRQDLLKFVLKSVFRYSPFKK